MSVFEGDVKVGADCSVRSRHPVEEADDVVCDLGYWKRILGAGQPSRAMANTTWKLTVEEQSR